VGQRLDLHLPANFDNDNDHDHDHDRNRNRNDHGTVQRQA